MMMTNIVMTMFVMEKVWGIRQWTEYEECSAAIHMMLQNIQGGECMSLCLTAVSLPTLIFGGTFWSFVILRANGGREYSSGECMTTTDMEHMFVVFSQEMEQHREDDTGELHRNVSFCVGKCWTEKVAAI